MRWDISMGQIFPRWIFRDSAVIVEPSSWKDCSSWNILHGLNLTCGCTSSQRQQGIFGLVWNYLVLHGICFLFYWIFIQFPVNSLQVWTLSETVDLLRADFVYLYPHDCEMTFGIASFTKQLALAQEWKVLASQNTFRFYQSQRNAVGDLYQNTTSRRETITR